MKSLRVEVVRYDDKLVSHMSMDTFMERLTKKLLESLPPKRFGQDKRDAQMAASLREAWLNLRTEMYAVGFKLKTWVDK